MTRKVIGGPMQPVKVVSDAEIASGAYKVEGFVAQPVHGYLAGERKQAGATAVQPVYVVGDAQIASGRFVMGSGDALPLAEVTGKDVKGRVAIPVYLVSGSLGLFAATGLTAVQSGADVVLAWVNNSTNQNEYRIYRATAEGGPYTLIDTIAAGSTSFTDTAPGLQQWWYKVAAANGAGETLSDAATVTVSLINAILGTQSANLVFLFPINETAGVTADNAEGTAARDGTYTGVDLNNAIGPDGEPVPYFDGTGDRVNIYSNSTRDAFDGSAGTIFIQFKVENLGVWTDGSWRHAIKLAADASNYVIIVKRSTNNQLTFWYTAGGTIKERTITISETGWITAALTWDADEDEVRAYYQGNQQGATFTGLGAWAGTLNSTLCTIGSQSSVGGQAFQGWEGNGALWNDALTSTEIAALSNTP